MIKGLVKGVLSGDTIIISGKLPKNGALPEEFQLTLTGVLAPKIGNSTKLNDEPYSYESREFLRKMVIGKVVLYKVDYTHNERKFGHIKLDDKVINEEILKNGYAKISFLPKGHENISKSELWTSLQEAEKEGKEKRRGIYADNSKNEKHIRNLYNLSDSEEDKKKIDEAIEKNLEIDAIIEYVFNCAFVSVYIPEWNCFAKVNLRFVSIPSNTKDPNLYKKGKAYCERICLSKDVKLKIYDFDENNNLICDITVLDKKQNLAEVILKEGYSKSFTGGNKNPKVYNLSDINLARAAESEAKSKRLGVWKDAVITETKKIKKEDEEDLSDVKCIMVNSGDSLTVLSKNKNEIRIFLSNLKAPALAKFGTEEQNKPWAFQSREFLRKKLVGKNLKCDLDYIHTVNLENVKTKGPKGSKESSKTMKFYTIYYQNEKDETECINVELISNGLANLTNYKIEEGNPSKEFDSMLKAETAAKSKKIGIYSPKTPPLCTYSDLLASGKTKKKEFVTFLTGLTHLNCVVDFCFSANKFKLRIDQKQVLIPFGLIGVKSFTNDKNNSSLFQKYFKISHDFVVNTILQRDGICDIVQADRVGNYFGNFLFEGKNFGTILIEKGLAVCNERSSDQGKNKYINEMRAAEEKAQKAKIGLWEDEGLAKLLKGESVGERSSEKIFNEVHKDITIRITDEIDLHKFYCNFLPNKTLDKIEEVLSDYDEGIRKSESLSLPIKNGTLCAAKFPDDNKYYRGIVKSHNKDKKEFEIEFIDYGNIEKVSLKDLIKLDGEISSLPPQAMFCELAYLKYSKMTMKKAVDKYPDFVDFDNQINAKLCYTYNQEGGIKNGLIVFKEGKDMKKTYHADLLKLGYAKLNRNKKLPDYMKPLDPIEKDAEIKELGVWDDNEDADYEQNEEDF